MMTFCKLCVIVLASTGLPCELALARQAMISVISISKDEAIAASEISRRAVRKSCIRSSIFLRQAATVVREQVEDWDRSTGPGRAVCRTENSQ